MIANFAALEPARQPCVDCKFMDLPANLVEATEPATKTEPAKKVLVCAECALGEHYPC